MRDPEVVTRSLRRRRSAVGAVGGMRCPRDAWQRDLNLCGVSRASRDIRARCAIGAILLGLEEVLTRQPERPWPRAHRVVRRQRRLGGPWRVRPDRDYRTRTPAHFQREQPTGARSATVVSDNTSRTSPSRVPATSTIKAPVRVGDARPHCHYCWSQSQDASRRRSVVVRWGGPQPAFAAPVAELGALEGSAGWQRPVP